MLDKNNVQWAGQFGVAMELSRRNMTIAFTLGNAKQCDLLATTSSGTQFRIEVKTQFIGGFWRFSEPLVEWNKYWIFVLIPEDNSNPLRYFIMISEEVNHEWHEYRNRIKENNPNVKEGNWGMNKTTVYPYENKWEKLRSK